MVDCEHYGPVVAHAESIKMNDFDKGYLLGVLAGVLATLWVVLVWTL